MSQWRVSRVSIISYYNIFSLTNSKLLYYTMLKSSFRRGRIPETAADAGQDYPESYDQNCRATRGNPGWFSRQTHQSRFPAGHLSSEHPEFRLIWGCWAGALGCWHLHVQVSTVASPVQLGGDIDVSRTWSHRQSLSHRDWAGILVDQVVQPQQADKHRRHRGWLRTIGLWRHLLSINGKMIKSLFYIIYCSLNCFYYCADTRNIAFTHWKYRRSVREQQEHLQVDEGREVEQIPDNGDLQWVTGEGVAEQSTATVKEEASRSIVAVGCWCTTVQNCFGQKRQSRARQGILDCLSEAKGGTTILQNHQLVFAKVNFLFLNKIWNCFFIVVILFTGKLMKSTWRRIVMALRPFTTSWIGLELMPFRSPTTGK